MSKKHGLWHSRIYKCWNNMIQRAGKHKNYKDINVCEDWFIFMNFYKWAMENGYSDDLTLDRKNYNLNYTPDNCRWITITEQQMNKKSNNLILYGNCFFTLTELSILFKININTLNKRLRSGWSVEESIYKHIRDINKKINYSSKYEGVCKHKQTGKWVASYKKKYIGIFKSEDEANLAVIKEREIKNIEDGRK